MQGWIVFWCAVIIVSWILFLGVSFLAAIRGWGELKEFYREIKAKHQG